MNNLQPQRPCPDSAAWLAEFQSLPMEELRQIIQDGMRLTAEYLMRLGCALHVYLERGGDLTGMDDSFTRHLRKIACGQILPELVAKYYASKPSLVRKIGSLPLDDQRRLVVDCEPVKLIVRGDNGERTHRMVDPANLRPDQVQQVFAHDHIRTEQEQHLYLDSIQTKKYQPVQEQIDNVTVDKERDGIIHKREFISRATIEAAMKVLRR